MFTFSPKDKDSDAVIYVHRGCRDQETQECSQGYSSGGFIIISPN